MAALNAMQLPIAKVRALDAWAPVMAFPAHVDPKDSVIVDMACRERPAVGAEDRDTRSPRKRNGVR
jgi:hypothetical protein